MSDAARALYQYLGRGALYIDRWDANGFKTGERFVGNVKAIEITQNDDTKDQYSSVEKATPLVLRVVTKRQPEFACELTEYERENLALALMGTGGYYTQAATPITGEAIAATGPGLNQDVWYKLAKRRITAVTVKKAGVATGVEGTDWEQDAEGGRIRFIKGGALYTAGIFTTTIDYTPTLITGTSQEQIIAGTATVIDASLRFISDPAAGPKQELEVWHVNINPDGALPLITDDYGSFKLKAAVLSDAANNPTIPYFRAIRRP